MSANVIAFLSMLAACEGAVYNALFGYPLPGRTFASFATHPNQKFSFTQTDGTIGWTTAAGRYQEIYPTFLRLQTKLGTVGFWPAVQDQHAVELIREAGALDLVESGDLGAAIDACSPTWASLPDSRYPQPVRPYSFAENAYRQAGGTVA